MSGFGRIGAAVLVALGVGLAGCGGGGSSDDDAGPAVPKAEGAYVYSNASGSGGLLLVLENDALWGHYWLDDGAHAGFVQGAGSTAGNTYTAAEVHDYDFVNRIVRTHSLSAQFQSGVSLDVTGTPITPAGPEFTLNATTAAVGSGYVYNQSASASAIGGNWDGTFGLSNEVVKATVSPQGTVSGSVDGTTCAFGGSILPRASGKNVYDVRFDFGPDCGGLTNATTAGIAIVSTDAQELMVLTQNADRTTGLTLIASRR